MPTDLELARDLYDGKIDSSFLQTPLPPCPYPRPEGYEGEWQPVDNRFKNMVDALVMDMARRGCFEAMR